MKKILLSALFIMMALCRLQAQEMETRVKVHCGEIPLEKLLTEEQKKSVTYLTVTGTLLDEDYAFIRKGGINQLDILNLKEAEIEVIPAYAFEGVQYEGSYFDPLRIILPLSLKHVREYAFCSNLRHCIFELTGMFPTLGESTFSKDGTDYAPWIETSSDNKYCTMVGYVVYSSDRTIMYYPNYDAIERWNCEPIPEGTKVISANAYENRVWPYKQEFVIPASIDSIGDRAFANFQVVIPDMSIDLRYIQLVCKAPTPPRLGKDVFSMTMKELFNLPVIDNGTLYVPDESVDTYKSTEGWNKFRIIKGISEKIFIPATIGSTKSHSSLSVKDEGDCYLLDASAAMKRIDLYNISGQRLSSIFVRSQQEKINKSILAQPYTIAYIHYENGTTKTVKLIP